MSFVIKWMEKVVNILSDISYVHKGECHIFSVHIENIESRYMNGGTIRYVEEENGEGGKKM